MTTASLIASSYVVLSVICDSLGLFRFAVQLRLPESLCVLTAFSPAACAGLTLGCFLANLLLGAAPLDIVFGTTATFFGAFLGRLISKNMKKKTSTFFIATLPTLFMNTLIMPPVIAASYGLSVALPVVFLTVFTGELISATILGTILGGVLSRIRSLEL